MSRQIILCLLAGALMLTGCIFLPKPSDQQTRPPLDSSLSKDCPELSMPPDSDIDKLIDWMLVVIKEYGICVSSHHATVQLWKDL